MPDGWSPISVYREGNVGVSPVFMIPGGGGRPQGVEEISAGLDPSIGVCSLSVMGADGGSAAAASVEETTELFFNAIRQHQPKGPYRFIGYSAGGVIAIELGRRLKAIGEDFEPLIFLDCLPAEFIGKNPSLLEKLWLARKWSPSFAFNWLSRYLASRKNRKIGQEALKKIEEGEVVDETQASQRMVLLTVEAMTKFEAEVVDFDIVLYRASLASLAFLAAGDKLGWDKLTTGELTVINKKCDHVTMLSNPVAEEIGRELNDLFATN